MRFTGAFLPWPGAADKALRRVTRDQRRAIADLVEDAWEAEAV